MNAFVILRDITQLSSIDLAHLNPHKYCRKVPVCQGKCWRETVPCARAALKTPCEREVKDGMVHAVLRGTHKNTGMSFREAKST